jgi:protein-tyrosine phosphatase
MELTELPFPFPGRIYRSAMPYSSYDPHGELIKAYKNHDVSLIVILSSDEEIKRITGRDLKSIYELEGFDILYLPIPDFSIPDMDEFRAVVEQVLTRSKYAKGSAIHCHAGLGRTGMFVACLAKLGMDFSGDEAMDWVRKVIPGAIEVPDQGLLVRLF